MNKQLEEQNKKVLNEMEVLKKSVDSLETKLREEKEHQQ